MVHWTVGVYSMSVLEKTIVYGSSLDAYSCIQTLLSMGLPGDKIILVHPPPLYEVIA